MARYEMITVEVNVKEGMDALSSLIEALAEMEGEKPDKQKTENEISGKTADQVAKADAGKPRLSLVPMQIVWEIEKIRRYGNEKYKEGGVDNWKQVDAERHFEAFLRHVVKAWTGDHLQIDPESGYMHLSHAACDLAFFMHLMAEKKEENDGQTPGKPD